jgi:hypothetical protein
MDIQGLLIPIFEVRSWYFPSRKLPVENPISFKLVFKYTCPLYGNCSHIEVSDV